MPLPKAKTRGTAAGGGKLAQQLAQQKADGGRTEEARREAAERENGKPLVVSARLSAEPLS